MAPIMKRFLCLCDLRLATAIVALYTLVLSLTSMAWYVARYVISDQTIATEEMSVVMYAAFAVYGAMLISCAVLSVGVLKDNRRLFRPWMVMIVLVLLFDTGAIALLTTLHLDSNKYLSSWDIGAIVLYVVRMISNIYCMMCVQSQYHVLSEQRKRNKNVQRSSNISCMDDVAIGMSPPPYSVEDPMKYRGSPAYDNGAMDSSV